MISMDNVCNEAIARAYDLTYKGVSVALADLREGIAELKTSIHPKQASKLFGIKNFRSFNTSPLLAKYCSKECAMHNMCYGWFYLTTYMQRCCPSYAYNHVLMNERSLDRDMYPDFGRKTSIVRVNVTGEMDNIIMRENLAEIIQDNPKKQFSQFTHRPEMWENGKPDNLTVIASVNYHGVIDDYIPPNCEFKYIVCDDLIPKELMSKVHRCRGKCNACMFCYSEEVRKGKSIVVANAK